MCLIGSFAEVATTALGRLPSAGCGNSMAVCRLKLSARPSSTELPALRTGGGRKPSPSLFGAPSVLDLELTYAQAKWTP